jgi:hypothetical protein
MDEQRRIKHRQKGHFYAAPKDRSRIVKIEIWEQETPHYLGSGKDTKWEHAGTSPRKYYRTEQGRDVTEEGDHFLTPGLDGVAVYRLSDDDLKKAGLL